ncbi:hypothetical protein ACMHYQ_11625 [Ectopseudomonas guguanensis]|uniref:hypothetical protein n=1 Tax=Ectopseudomonas guguanensis TaxID=1198456 RepID=UPI0039C475CD
MKIKYIIAAILFISHAANGDNSFEEDILNDSDKQWILTVSSDAKIDGVGIAEFDKEDKCIKSLLVVDMMANDEDQKNKRLYAKCWRKTDTTRKPGYIIRTYDDKR